jgi:hypothetical protein
MHKGNKQTKKEIQKILTDLEAIFIDFFIEAMKMTICMGGEEGVDSVRSERPAPIPSARRDRAARWSFQC